MKDDDILKDLHIGKIIKEIALQKGVSSKKIAATIRRDLQNADKIFKMTDMDVEDIVNISYLLEYNILEFISQKYLSHLPYIGKSFSADSCLLKIDMRTERITTYDAFNSDFLKKTHIGQHIRELAKKKKWNERDMANIIHCSQGWISILYGSKSLKIKKLIQISDTLHYNFIAEVYLSQMVITISPDKFDNCIIALHPDKVRIINSDDNTVLMVFRQSNDKN